MKILKSRIFQIVLTAIICISGTVYATTAISANQVEYNNSTVEAALNSLYTEITNYLALTVGTAKTYIGDRNENTSITETIPAGKSLLLVVENAGATSTSISNTEIDYMSFGITGDDGVCSLLSNKGYRATASEYMVANSTNYRQSYTVVGVYYCNTQTSKTVTIIPNDTLNTATKVTKTLVSETIKLR